MISNSEIPVPSTLEEVNTSLEKVREEHRSLLSEIAEARQFTRTKELQMKQLEDHFKYLEKEHLRIQDWDKQVMEREQQINKHYTLVADTGVLGATMGNNNGVLQ